MLKYMTRAPKIIYEDKNVLVLDKPAGLPVHGDGRNTKIKTLADWITENYPAIEKVGEPMLSPEGIEIARPGIVHRLDRETSGLIVIAKTQEAFVYLKNQFKNRKVKKTYVLITCGDFKRLVPGEVGKIDLPIGRTREDARIRLASNKAVGKQREALTYYRLIENFNDYAYIEANPKTGRTHQLRAHFKAINHPILSDKLYGACDGTELGIKRVALHAHKLEFFLPQVGRREFEAPLPKDMVTALEKLKTL